MSAWKSGPGRPDQKLHVDYRPIDLPEDVANDPRVDLPIFIATAHLYLNDITEDLGPTMMIPGSHRAGRKPREDETDWKDIQQQSVRVNAGDVVMFRSEIWHRGSANTSAETRYLIQVHYANRWISSRMPPYLNKFQFDPTLLAMATPRQRRLLGDHVIAGAYT
jgi:ectoine hydroxylase-related dioxygenase (phytanoyl-CoA dioxygenase family)